MKVILTPEQEEKIEQVQDRLAQTRDAARNAGIIGGLAVHSLVKTFTGIGWELFKAQKDVMGILYSPAKKAHPTRTPSPAAGQPDPQKTS